MEFAYSSDYNQVKGALILHLPFAHIGHNVQVLVQVQVFGLIVSFRQGWRCSLFLVQISSTILYNLSSKPLTFPQTQYGHITLQKLFLNLSQDSCQIF